MRNAIGFRGGAITAEASRPVTCFYPPLYFGAYFFKRAVSFHCALAPPIFPSRPCSYNKIHRHLLHHSVGSLTRLATARDQSMPRSAAQPLL